MSAELRMIPLKQVLQQLDVGVASVGPEEKPAQGEWGVIRLGAVASGQFRADQVKRWPGARPPKSGLEIKPGDLLVVRVNGSPKLVGSVCRVAEVPPKLMLSDLVMRLVPDPAVMDSRFLELALSSTHGRRQIEMSMRGTSGQFQLPQGELKSVQVPWLPLRRQRRIVEVLGAVVDQERALEAAIAKLRSLRGAALADLLGRGGAGTSRALGDVLHRVESGWSPVCEPTEPGGSEWGVLGLGAVTSGVFLEREAKRLPSSLSPRRPLEVCEGDVLIARANGSKRLVGVGAVVPADVRSRLIFPDLVYRLAADESVLQADYLGYLIAAPLFRRQVEGAMRSTSGQFKISKGDLREFRIPVPSLSEQQLIVRQLRAWDRRIASEQDALVKLRALKAGLVDDLLSGRTALSDAA
ncbi:restriction endonuclease subunit S [Streptomyces sp. UC4497]